MNLKKVVCLITLVMLFGCRKENILYGDIPLVESEKADILALVNGIRTKGCHCGAEFMAPVQPIGWDPTLELTARQHSVDMFLFNYLSTEGSDGSTFQTRILNAGYDNQPIAEHCAYGYQTPQTAVAEWFNNSKSCKNLMSPDIRNIGVGRFGSYWTQDLGGY